MILVKPIIQRVLAEQDIDQAVNYYLQESPIAAMNFIDDLEDAFNYVNQHPAIGSLRYAHELNLPGLKAWGLRRFPYTIFYIEREDYIDVWRILHSQMDIPIWLCNE